MIFLAAAYIVVGIIVSGIACSVGNRKDALFSVTTGIGWPLVLAYALWATAHVLTERYLEEKL